MEMLAATNTEAEDQDLTWDPCRGALGWESQQLFRLKDTPRPGLNWSGSHSEREKKKKKGRDTYTG